MKTGGLRFWYSRNSGFLKVFLEVKEVKKPRSLSERTRERRQVAPPERGKMKEASPEKGKPEEAPPDNVLRENLRDGTEREGEKGRR